MADYKNKEWLQKELELLGSGREISKKYGIGKTTIAKWLKKHGLSKPPKNFKEVKDYQKPEWIIEELSKGKSLKNIALEQGLSAARMYQLSEELGIETVSLKKEAKLFRNKEWLTEMVGKYKTLTEIAKATGEVID